MFAAVRFNDSRSVRLNFDENKSAGVLNVLTEHGHGIAYLDLFVDQSSQIARRNATNALAHASEVRMIMLNLSTR